MGIKVSVNSVPTTRVSINNQVRETIRTASVGVPIVNDVFLSDIKDVMAVNPANNDVLVYDANLAKYVVKTLPVADGGTF